MQSCEDVTLESTNTSVLLGIGREEINMAIYGFLSAQTWKLFKRKQNCQITHFLSLEAYPLLPFIHSLQITLLLAFVVLLAAFFL